jgi:thioredoxin-dependent peroxiredoxin
MANTKLKVGDKAPEFSLPDTNENEISSNDLKGKWLVLYFYPKDNTPGCTVEAIDFTAKIKEFANLNATVVGVSPDSCKSHQNFTQKHHLKVNLLSDPVKKTLQDYGVWREKSMFGKKYMGIVRTTYLVNPNGKIAAIWPKVKVKGHSEEVLNKLKELHTK